MDHAQKRHTQLSYGGRANKHELQPNESEYEFKTKKLRSVRAEAGHPLVPVRKSIVQSGSGLPTAPGAAAVRKLVCRSSEPWADAPKLFAKGPTIICKGGRYQRLHVAIERRQHEAGEVRDLRHVSHQNIADLLDVYLSSTDLYFVYEYMDVSLRNIASLTRSLSHSEIGIACKAVGPHSSIQKEPF